MGTIVKTQTPFRHKKNKVSKNDFYQTPPVLVKRLLETGELDGYKSLLEPACGKNAIVNVLKEYGYEVDAKDLELGNNFLTDVYTQSYDVIITNPPFKIWDEFVVKAKSIDCQKIVFLGPLTYLAAHSRYANGIWDELSDVYILDHQIMFKTTLRNDDKIDTGMLTTAWYVWTKGYKDIPHLHILDIHEDIAHKKDNKNTEQHKELSLWF